ncbi:S-adenosyl-L-methionine-dependent methyltransferase [Pelagophyceae sp. CCMP2097]|nr:S-adenosyl-L-methionine-dependent methyltransferase [Pelagophyceae sp. CCMP2097]
MGTPTDELKDDSRAAVFPTARLVAACRARDALRGRRIGSNVGSGADDAAAIFAGEAGAKFLDDIRKASVVTPESPYDTVELVILRTLLIDAAVMRCVAAGVRQFVLLGAGLDARAWRLALPGDATVFELDVPEAHAFKANKVPLVETAHYPSGPACGRCAIGTDLRNAAWVDDLQGAGFNRSRKALFVCEGLLMYLTTKPAVETLLKQVAGLMAPGSELVGDCFLSFLASAQAAALRPALRAHGGNWTFELPDDKALKLLLRKCGFDVAIVDAASAGDALVENAAPAAGADAAAAAEAAQRELRKVDSLQEWQAEDQKWLRAELASEHGAADVAAALAKRSWQLRGANEKTRCLAVELMFDGGLQEKLEAGLRRLDSAQRDGRATVKAKPARYVIYTASSRKQPTQAFRSKYCAIL